jgi:hypothetical protein
VREPTEEAENEGFIVQRLQRFSNERRSYRSKVGAALDLKCVEP